VRQTFIEAVDRHALVEAVREIVIVANEDALTP
jgi:hypothetical protein